LSGETVFRALLVVGAVCGLASLWLYDNRGFSRWMLLLWLAAPAALSIFFWSRSRALPRVHRLDLLAPVGLVVGFAPLYLLSLYRNPVQVSSDEVVIIDVAENLSSADGVDPFGISYYFARPTLLFLGWGRLGDLLGGFDLYHMRFLHALVGLLTIAASYALLRQLLPRGWAIFATVVFGASHSMLMISRLAMRENTAVLLEVAALALLLWGLRRNHLLVTFWGGFVAGLGLYVYFPARATFPLWIALLVGAGVLFRRAFTPRRLVVLGSTAIAGFILMAAPVLIAESKAPDLPTSQPQKETLMIFDLGREKQKEWMQTTSFVDAYKTNVKWGLTVFNNDVNDHAFIYENLGHGFVDPLTGILLWLGVGVVALRLVRRRADEGALLALGSFVVLWLSFAFLVNKAPNYTRLLITLPFVAYFVAEAVRWVGGRWRSVRYAPAVLAGAALLALVGWNLAIARDYLEDGKRRGDPIGSTGRYVASHRDTPGQIFYLATSNSAPYYVWGDAGVSTERLTLFAKEPSQIGVPIDPFQIGTFRATPPLALFMRREIWQPHAAELADTYPRGRIRNVTPDGTRVVLEVPY
jgi:hypothetical protein